MKILIGLSGGLDSTYAAHLLKEMGHEVHGAAVIMHEYTDTSAALKAALSADILYVEIDKRGDFQSKVVDPFTSDYSSGRTPNPCILCNPEVKFAALCDYAAENGFDKVATGHYSAVVNENGRYFIRISEDTKKDQSYVLWRLTQKQLSMLCLPLSGMKKEDIREKAEALGLEAAKAPESQENCFIPDDDYASFIENRLGKSFPEGNFIDRNGKILGKHRGIIHYTVGQRKGLGIALGEPMFVSSISPENNTVTLVRSGEEYFSSMKISELSFMKLEPTEFAELDAGVKVRYSAKPVGCHIKITGNTAEVTFSAPIRAVTAGQSAVFYDGNDLLFGGFIEKAELI